VGVRRDVWEGVRGRNSGMAEAATPRRGEGWAQAVTLRQRVSPRRLRHHPQQQPRQPVRAANSHLGAGRRGPQRLAAHTHAHTNTHTHAHESIHAPRRSANCASFVMASASSRITSFTPVEKSLRVPAGQEGWRGAWRLEGESSRGVDALPVAAQGFACFAALAQPPPGQRRRRSTLPPPHTPARGTRQRMT